MREIGDLSLSHLSAGIQQGRITPTEAVEGYLSRIARLDGTLNSFLTLTPDLAQRAATESEGRMRSGRPLGPLDGVSVAIKDLLDLEGVPAGAVLLGKLNMHEEGGPMLPPPGHRR